MIHGIRNDKNPKMTLWKESAELIMNQAARLIQSKNPGRNSILTSHRADTPARFLLGGITPHLTCQKLEGYEMIAQVLACIVFLRPIILVTRKYDNMTVRHSKISSLVRNRVSAPR